MTNILRGLGLAVLAVIAVIWFVTPGRAAERWVAAMEDDEGGPTMVASVSGEGNGSRPPEVRIMCGGEQGLNLHYDSGDDPDGIAGQPGGGADFMFENEHDQIKLHMIYEDMDGAFAAYFPADDKMVALLETGSDLIVTPDGPDAAAQTFPLQGSTKAITALIAYCQQ